MIVCITEKPSVAKDIAAILGATKRNDGFFEGNNYCVTWTFGHLCTLKEPADYTEHWKRWTLSSLPMLPPRFGIKLIKDRGIEHQFSVIETLVSKADEVINCGDAGQEGELIQRWVLQKAATNCKVKRLWISSLTDEAIRTGFEELKPERDFDNLYHAGLSRAIGDWILGMNATRLYSLKYSEPGKVLSIGRVQTPTLALIVQRHKEIANFTPEDFWELKTVYRSTLFSSTLGRFKNEAEASAMATKIKDSLFTIIDVQQKKGKETPPRLFDLTSLQVEANKRWGWSAEETLKLIQSLYEKKVTTYPRVDTTYLSEDIHKKIPGIFKQMTPYHKFIQPLLAKPIPKPKRIFDNSKVTDHHAIIPTGQNPSILVGNEKQLYHLIALRFIAAFYPDCEFQQTTVVGESADLKFKATGKVIEKPGWREILTTEKGSNKGDASSDNDNDNQNRELPHFTVGESGPHDPKLTKGATTPPKLYTEGTLLRAMETAGKTVDDDELRDALKENGIGRPSTRAAIIETLFKRGYIHRERKSLDATEAGIALIDTIDEELLKSAKLTGLWENKLRRIERGDYSASEFISELKEMVAKIVLDVMSDNSRSKISIQQGAPQKEEKKSKTKKSSNATEPSERKPRAKAIKTFEEIECPECHTGHIIKGRTAYGCSRFKEGCSMRLPFSEYPDSLTPTKLKKAIQSKKK